MKTLTAEHGTQPPYIAEQFSRLVDWMEPFGFASATGFALIMNAIYADQKFSAPRLAVVMVALFSLHMLLRLRVLFTRESVIYLCFLLYMAVSTLWAPNINDAANTLWPAFNFLIIMLFFGSLVAYRNLRALLTGMVFGFAAGAAFYTLTTRFPLVRPDDFSYNAIASIYLYGLFSVLIWAWCTKRRLLGLMMAILAMMLIAATTSIKTNLGVLLGVLAAALFYFGTFIRILSRSAIALLLVIIAVGYAIASSESLVERLQEGVDRVTIGAQVLGEREDNSQGTSFNDREYWQRVGIRGWKENPIFGSGIEAFRSDIGITSHSTVIDLLYNHGLIGLTLFYSLFASLLWRLYRSRGSHLGGLPVLVFAGVTCYSFMSLSEPLHYNTFFGVFVAVTAGLLARESHSQT
ncbi:MAG TPA: O-antigen ligase family protein [Steroidobacteraceae bacterium]